MPLRHILPTPVHDQSPSGASRFVTSGELQSGAGTGDAVKAGFNIWTGTNVFTAATAVALSGLTTFGTGGTRISPQADLQASGIVVVYAGAYAGSITGAQRYVTSGELSAGAGSGDAQRGALNYWSAQNVFAGETVTSGLLSARGLVTISGGFTAYTPLLDAAGRRFLVSGEGGGSGGTGDATRTAPNYFTDVNVFAGVTTASGSLIAAGGVQISGGFTAYGPLRTHAGQRFVTSGELVTIPSGITTLNDQTGPAVTINTGTAGQDFNVSTAGNIITVNLPTASPFARGKMTFGVQTFSGTKGFADSILALGGMQLSGTSIAYAPIHAGIVVGSTRLVTSGELVLIPSGLTTLNSQTGPAVSITTGSAGNDVGVSAAGNVVTVSVPDASLFARGVVTITAQTISGSKAFAGPLALLNELQVSGIAIHYAPLFAGVVGGATRFVTSGELAATGTGDFVKAQANYVSGTPQVFAGLVAISGVLQLGGGTQLSGTTITYGPLWQRTAGTAAQRYVTSGELVLIPSGLTTLNTQIGPAVAIAVGTTGNDLNVVAAGNVVTLHVPDAGLFSRGVVTTTAQTISGVKTLADNLVLRGALQTSGVVIAYGGVYGGSVGGASRFVTSGELQAAAGTGDATRTSANYFSALNVFGGTLAASGSLIAGAGTQISGAFIAYGPLYQRIAVGAQRYLVSGEMVVIPSGITTINAQVGPAINITVGNLGSDFDVFISPNNVQINLPDAGFTARGAVTTLEQTFGGFKILNAGALIRGATQVSGVTLTYGGLYGEGLTGGHRYLTSGELSSAGTGDAQRGQVNYWSALNVFAGTIAASGSLVAGAGTQISGGFLTYAPLHYGSVDGANRYLTSGELAPPAAGSGDFVKAQDNYVTGAQQVFAASATVAISGQLIARNPAGTFGTRIGGQPDIFGMYWFFSGSGIIGGPCTYTAPVTFQADARFTLGNVQVSGVTLHYAPIYDQTQAGPQRYMASGEVGAAPLARVVATRGSNTPLNSTNETTVVSYTVPGNTLLSGQALAVEVLGDARANGTTTFVAVSRFGGVLLYSGAVTGVTTLQRGPVYFYLFLSAINSGAQFAQGHFTTQNSVGQLLMSGINTGGITNTTRMAVRPTVAVDATQDRSLVVTFRANTAGSEMNARVSKVTYYP